MQIYKVNTIKDNIFVQIENQMLIVLSTNDIDKMIYSKYFRLLLYVKKVLIMNAEISFSCV